MVTRRARGKTVCARGAHGPLLGGRSTSPLDAAVLDTLTIALIFLYSVVFVMSVAGMLVFNTMLRLRLQTHHPDVLAQLASGIALPRNSGSLWSWVWARRYDDMADPVMVRLVLLYRICASALIGSIAVAAAAVLVTKFFHVGGI